MSWDSYIEHLMVDLPHGGKLSSAAIVGQDGGVWAQSEGFPAITPDQIAAIMAGFASYEKAGHAGELGSTGIKLGEEKFQVSGFSSLEAQLCCTLDFHGHPRLLMVLCRV